MILYCICEVNEKRIYGCQLKSQKIERGHNHKLESWCEMKSTRQKWHDCHCLGSKKCIQPEARRMWIRIEIIGILHEIKLSALHMWKHLIDVDNGDSTQLREREEKKGRKSFQYMFNQRIPPHTHTHTHTYDRQSLTLKCRSTGK